MREHAVQHDGPRVGVGQRQLPAVALLERQGVDALAEFSRPVQQQRRWIDAENLDDGGYARNLARDLASAAADL
jgi:hypothetical protein